MSTSTWMAILLPARRNRVCSDGEHPPDVGARACQHALGLPDPPRIAPVGTRITGWRTTTTALPFYPKFKALGDAGGLPRNAPREHFLRRESAPERRAVISAKRTTPVTNDQTRAKPCKYSPKSTSPKSSSRRPC